VVVVKIQRINNLGGHQNSQEQSPFSSSPKTDQNTELSDHGAIPFTFSPLLSLPNNDFEQTKYAGIQQ
jgi:hypothetical protein